MNDEMKNILNKFDKKKLESYELDKKFGQLSIDSICHLFPNEITTIKDYITNLQKENEELKQDNIIGCEKFIKQKQRINKAIAVINTQMKNLSKDEAGNLRIIKFNLIKGSCTPLDLTTEEDYKY